MHVLGIMSKPVITIERHERLRTAARLMHQHHIGALVVTAVGRPVGMLTESDIVKALGDGTDPDATRVVDRMSAPLYTLRTEASLSDAVALMRKHTIRRLVIVRGEEVVGIVTVSDLARQLPEAERRELDAIQFRWQQ